jgi:predicted metal-dependent HD superfamily phosphohydrolase
MQVDMMALRQTWEKLCDELKIPCGAVFELIAQRYGEPHRFYHGVHHVESLLKLLHDDFPTLAKDRAAVELALWFHDIVYDPRARDNEEKSAALMSSVLGKALAPDLERKVVAFILATKHDMSPADPDAQLVVDIDLSTLGAPPEDFQRYSDSIRKENFWVPEAEYRRSRKATLERFLAQSPLYHHLPLRQRFEAQARRNLTEALAELKP